jgi:hypothetical protein
VPGIRKQPPPCEQRRLDFGVARQDRRVHDAEPCSRLALGEQEIVDALFGHHPRGFFGHRLTQHLCARVGSLSTHVTPSIPNRIGSATGFAQFVDVSRKLMSAGYG